MPTNTYVALDKITVGTATATVTFSSIPQGYTDLVMIVSAKTNTTAAQIYMTINGDAGSNYSRTILFGTGSSAGSARNSNQTVLFADYYGIMNTTDFNMDTFHFMNYSNTTTYKTVLSRTNLAASGVDAMAHLWRSTSAITSILVGNYGYNFSVGSTFSLYGIKSEEAASKATGGMVTSDANYYYHTFTSSGTFTPTQSLTADVLCVAGGGGGGGARLSVHYAGGGGAGGVLGFASQSLTATGYTVTVGGGGTAGTGGTVPTNGGQGVNSQFGALTASVGGGSGATAANNGGAGGSGGGGGSAGVTTSGGAATSGQGFAGGGSTTNYWSGGGGGAGAVGANGTSTTGSGYGGAGTNTVTNWGSLSNTVTATGIGVSGYIAGGGQGTATAVFVSAAGGGGVAGADSGGSGGTPATAGTANTGSGGGAGSPNGTQNGAAGGSGIVIVRYAK